MIGTKKNHDIPSITAEPSKAKMSICRNDRDASPREAAKHVIAIIKANLLFG
jgi:hypothetical protein